MPLRIVPGRFPRLGLGNSVTEAMYDAGFNSSGRFYEIHRPAGHDPDAYRAGGANEEIRFAVGETSLGAILVASSKKGVASILAPIPTRWCAIFRTASPSARLIGADGDYEALVARVVGFVEAPISVSICRSMCVAPRSSSGFGRRFRRSRSVRRFPHAEVARRIGSPTAVRAVAGACAANISRGGGDPLPPGREE